MILDRSSLTAFLVKKTKKEEKKTAYRRLPRSSIPYAWNTRGARRNRVKKELAVTMWVNNLRPVPLGGTGDIFERKRRHSASRKGSNQPLLTAPGVDTSRDQRTSTAPLPPFNRRKLDRYRRARFIDFSDEITVLHPLAWASSAIVHDDDKKTAITRITIDHVTRNN